MAARKRDRAAAAAEPAAAPAAGPKKAGLSFEDGIVFATTLLMVVAIVIVYMRDSIYA